MPAAKPQDADLLFAGFAVLSLGQASRHLADDRQADKARDNAHFKKLEWQKRQMDIEERALAMMDDEHEVRKSVRGLSLSNPQP